MEFFCEEIQTRHVDDIEVLVESCRLDQLTTRNSTEVAFVLAMKPMTELFLDYNVHTHFLPIKTAEKFPNLISYSANFILLNKLQRLAINNNQIENIDGDTFEDLIELKFLFLDNNKIATFNGIVLENLPNLKVVDLEKNSCIDRDFFGQSQITKRYEILSL
jgi:Leucine rich repeat